MFKLFTVHCTVYSQASGFWIELILNNGRMVEYFSFTVVRTGERYHGIYVLKQWYHHISDCTTRYDKTIIVL